MTKMTIHDYQPPERTENYGEVQFGETPNWMQELNERGKGRQCRYRVYIPSTHPRHFFFCKRKNIYLFDSMYDVLCAYDLVMTGTISKDLKEKKFHMKKKEGKVDRRYKQNSNKTLLDRVKEKIEIDPETDCWMWTGYVTKKHNSPKITWYEKHDGIDKPYKVFKTVVTSLYEEVYGSRVLPFVRHKCRRSACVNPDHFYESDIHKHTIEGIEYDRFPK